MNNSTIDCSAAPGTLVVAGIAGSGMATSMKAFMEYQSGGAKNRVTYSEMLADPTKYCHESGEMTEIGADVCREEASMRASEADSPNSPDYDRICEDIEEALTVELFKKAYPQCVTPGCNR